MKHFFVMSAFALAAAVVFGTISRDNSKERIFYGAKVFAEFLIIGLILAWILYFIPF